MGKGACFVSRLPHYVPRQVRAWRNSFLLAMTMTVGTFGACSGSSNGVQDLPPGDPAETEWVEGWSCDGLRETFIAGDPASDPLHEWTQADVAAAQAEYADRC